MTNSDEILAEAQKIYEGARNYYYYLLDEGKGTHTMLLDAEKQMLDAYSHLLDMRYATGQGMMD